MENRILYQVFKEIRIFIFCNETSFWIYFLANPGLVFTNVNADGTLPNHVIYKIRQNATSTVTTKLVRPQYWKAGPDGSSYSYYKYGFVWLQVGDISFYLTINLSKLLSVGGRVEYNTLERRYWQSLITHVKVRLLNVFTSHICP